MASSEVTLGKSESEIRSVELIVHTMQKSLLRAAVMYWLGRVRDTILHLSILAWRHGKYQMHKNYLYLPYNLPYSWAKDITKLTCSSRFLNDIGEWWIHSILVLYWILWEIHTIIIFVKSVAFGKCFALLCWSSKEYKSLNSICFHLHSCKSKGESDVVYWWLCQNAWTMWCELKRVWEWIWQIVSQSGAGMQNSL